MACIWRTANGPKKFASRGILNRHRLRFHGRLQQEGSNSSIPCSTIRLPPNICGCPMCPPIPPKESAESPISTIGKKLLSPNNCIYLVRLVGKPNGAVNRKQARNLRRPWPQVRLLRARRRRERGRNLPGTQRLRPPVNIHSALSFAWVPSHGASFRNGLSRLLAAATERPHACLRGLGCGLREPFRNGDRLRHAKIAT